VSKLICNGCRQQRVKGKVGDKHSACGGTFVELIQRTVNVPMEKRTALKGEGKGCTARGAGRKGY